MKRREELERENGGGAAGEGSLCFCLHVYSHLMNVSNTPFTGLLVNFLMKK